MSQLNDVVISVVGARPQFVKVYPLVRAMAGLETRHMIVHTGQHYSEGMSKIFFEQFAMPDPDINLNVGSGSHAEQTAKVMTGFEQVVREVNPKAVVVYGDTNSTLGATLAAVKYYYPLVHIEAGVRQRNRRMPEEINRRMIDVVSDYLACPSDLAVRNLAAEGITDGVSNPGDFMYDSFLLARSAADSQRSILPEYGLTAGNYILSTIHREASTDDPRELIALLDTLGSLGTPVILPMHPRTQNRLRDGGYSTTGRGELRIIDPVGYLQMVQLLAGAQKVVTDSGGLQKEAYWSGVPCVTMMEDTAWQETVEAGWNVLVGTDRDAIRRAVALPRPAGQRPEVYGKPGAAERFVAAMGWG
jgi:UDP-N-acetylglucosamine 2-epimerase